eukprot:TRINITY_DN2250_c0_g1_i1.p1 TRINITY_DN2250_c0_g1~~TRINITY_DN2250_c0_g1_i1.p1  ORF type:complete len:237 (-),score=54.62 TRINITY_DN2250_c0_g1_i1:351-1061(-)
MSESQPEQKHVQTPEEKAASAKRARYWLKAANVINAIFLCVAGVIAIIQMGEFNISSFLIAVYVTLFGLVLCFFEVHLRSCDDIIAANFGFMFKWGGRLCFLVFIGVLCFTLGVLGIIAGCVTAANLIFNLFVLCKYGSDVGSREQPPVQMQAQSTVSPNAQTTTENISSASSTGSTTDSNPFTLDVAVSAGGQSVKVPVKVNLAEWDRVLDQTTGKYYYFNKATKESKWESEVQV